MKKRLFWEGPQQDYVSGKQIGNLIDPEEVSKVVSTFEFNFYSFPGVPGVKENDYELPEKANLQDMDEDELVALLEKIVGVKPERETADYVTIEDVLCYDIDQCVFFNLATVESVLCHEYSSGGNWERLFFNEAYDTGYELEIIESCVLDIWDGSNHYFPMSSTGNHAILEKVIVDGNEKALFWHKWSQWQGSEVDTGYFVTREEAEELLRSYDGRDPHPELDYILEWMDR